MIDIDIFTDGSSIRNGKPDCVAGWSACIPDYSGLQVIRYGQLGPPSSNNQGEAMGVFYALQMFAQAKDFRAIIHSDSQYVVKSCNEWRYKWAKSDYDGVKNLNILIPLFNLIDRSVNKPVLKWVKGHAGHRGNELADEYAGYGMRGIKQSVDSDTQSIVYVPEPELQPLLAAWR